MKLSKGMFEAQEGDGYDICQGKVRLPKWVAQYCRQSGEHLMISGPSVGWSEVIRSCNYPSKIGFQSPALTGG